ncbi:hypothetical protein SAMN05421840_10610 [Shewanella morhuae]|nr:hypothetical protein SAMN05421840_10610 [Shewanella morhuae]
MERGHRIIIKQIYSNNVHMRIAFDKRFHLELAQFIWEARKCTFVFAMQSQIRKLKTQ